MRALAGIFLLCSFYLSSSAQIKIHSHNDYAQQNPFHTAYLNKVDQIEADLFLVGDSLIVAHSKRELKPSNTLYNLYLKPIAVAFTKHKGKVSEDKHYTFSLMIDIKEKWSDVYPVLQKEIEKYGNLFDRSSSKNAIQIVISGSRPDHVSFPSFPKWVYFDGLPNMQYSKKELKRITMISDNFANYTKWRGVGEIPAADKAKLSAAIVQAHKLHKPIRFWGAPDTEACWSQLAALGTDIINTDKITESKNYFGNSK
jgi:hypothetical protein